MRVLALLLPTLLLATSTASAASPTQQQQRVYQWKDAKGVPHYTDIKPSQTHQTRDLDVRDGIDAGSKPEAAPESEQCRNARANLKRLQGSEAIGIDTNGDGKPDRNMNGDERKAQQDLNQAAVTAYCNVKK